MALKLPKKRSKPAEGLGEYSMLLYGREKIGKTTLCAEFPDAFFMMCEPGGKALSVYQAPVTSWRDFVRYVDLLEAEPERFGTVCIDTADLAYRLCQRAVCKTLGISHPSEEEYGKGWDRVREEFVLTLQRLLNGPRGVIITSHAKEKEIKRRSGLTSTRIVPTMSGQARDIIEPMVDIWAYYAYDDEGGRQLHMRGDDLISAGHRLEKNFVDVEVIDMGRTAKQGFRNFCAAFAKTETEREEPTTRRTVKRRVKR